MKWLNCFRFFKLQTRFFKLFRYISRSTLNPHWQHTYPSHWLCRGFTCTRGSHHLPCRIWSRSESIIYSQQMQLNPPAYNKYATQNVFRKILISCFLHQQFLDLSGSRAQNQASFLQTISGWLYRYRWP